MAAPASTERDFSQFGEQATILAWAGERKGSFVDVGAYDGQTFSNTRALALRGWNGILLEPAPDAVAAAIRIYADRDDVLVLPGACWLQRGLATLTWTPGQPYSSLYPGSLDGQPREVACCSPSDLAALMHGRPRPWLLSLDCEGATLELLPELLAELDPDCVVVEAHEALPDERAVALANLGDRGLAVLASNPVNVIAAVCS